MRDKANSTRPAFSTRRLVALVLLLGLLATAPFAFGGDKKKKKEQAQAEPQSRSFLEGLDLSKIVWPNPPAITRIKYLDYFSGEKFKPKSQQKAKSSWMDRLSGITTGGTPADSRPRFQLVVPYGLAVDSKGRLYIADSKVRAIFIVNTETGDFEMIKNGSDARFQWLTGLVIDDSDRLYAADSGMRRIIVFDPQHKAEGTISQGLRDPGGMAIDNENRLLYVTDAELDQVLVYDADPPYKLLRKMGTPNSEHRLTSQGDFSKPTNVAVDKDGNVYVSDTWNDRIQVFDADGQFIRAFGKAGDGPGYFARPKGIAIDSDGHVWVADAVQNRVQVFTPEGRLLIWMGGKGLYPGEFQSLAGLTIDSNNRVFTSEQLPGRVQFFRYITDAEAKAELQRRGEQQKTKAEADREAIKAKESEPKQ
ncbi:MAG: SMP-30/gluconolactonase/LRE family protein [Acidobacteriaceae bacterium]